MDCCAVRFLDSIDRSRRLWYSEIVASVIRGVWDVFAGGGFGLLIRFERAHRYRRKY